jgi:hypothetical protein
MQGDFTSTPRTSHGVEFRGRCRSTLRLCYYCSVVLNSLRVLSASTIRAIAPMMETVGTSETSVSIYQTTRHNMPEDSHVHTNRTLNLNGDQSVLPSQPPGLETLVYFSQI